MIKQFDGKVIEQYIEDNKLRRQWNKDHSLQVLDYTKGCVVNGQWDEITMACRGIVLDENYKVVMPCMPKFFNFDQLTQEHQQEVVEEFKNNKHIISQKYDGCLAAIFLYKGELVITSKCSFNSFVTDAVKEILNNNYQFKKDLEDTSLGIICEVIHPDTHILVNYGDLKELRVITTYSLVEDDVREWDFDMTKKLINTIHEDTNLPIYPVETTSKFNFSSLKNWQETHDSSEEGFVVWFENGERVKFKSKQYLACAAAVQGMSYKKFVKILILEYNGEKDSLEYIDRVLNKFIEDLPDECMGEAKSIKNLIKTIYAMYSHKTYGEYFSTHNLTDKELGLNKAIPSWKKSWIFKLRKGKSIVVDILKKMLVDWDEDEVGVMVK